jgi:hypothetical protein
MGIRAAPLPDRAWRHRQVADSARPGQRPWLRPAPSTFLARLIQDEVARREQKKFHLRVRRAGFRSTKTLEQFDRPTKIEEYPCKED